MLTIKGWQFSQHRFDTVHAKHPSHPINPNFDREKLREVASNALVSLETNIENWEVTWPKLLGMQRWMLSTLTSSTRCAGMEEGMQLTREKNRPGKEFHRKRGNIQSTTKFSTTARCSTVSWTPVWQDCHMFSPFHFSWFQALHASLLYEEVAELIIVMKTTRIELPPLGGRCFHIRHLHYLTMQAWDHKR